MCDWVDCEPTFDGYVYWEHEGTNAFKWIAEPEYWERAALRGRVKGSLDLTIPYI